MYTKSLNNKDFVGSEALAIAQEDLPSVRVPRPLIFTIGIGDNGEVRPAWTVLSTEEGFLEYSSRVENASDSLYVEITEIGLARIVRDEIEARAFPEST